MIKRQPPVLEGVNSSTPTLVNSPTPFDRLTIGSILYGLYVLEMLIGLILTSLAVTGFTGLLKGDDDPR